MRHPAAPAQSSSRTRLEPSLEPPRLPPAHWPNGSPLRACAVAAWRSWPGGGRSLGPAQPLRLAPPAGLTWPGPGAEMADDSRQNKLAAAKKKVSGRPEARPAGPGCVLRRRGLVRAWPGFSGAALRPGP